MYDRFVIKMLTFFLLLLVIVVGLTTLATIFHIIANIISKIFNTLAFSFYPRTYDKSLNMSNSS